MRLLNSLIVATSLIFAPTIAFAHTHVSASTPVANALVSAPKQISITFSEAIRTGESRITVYNSNHKKINDGLVTNNDDDKFTAIAPLPSDIAPGIYEVKWKAVCLCTDHHATTGHYKFTVK